MGLLRLIQDARRYRWLRKEVAGLQGMEWLTHMDPNELDEYIDRQRYEERLSDPTNDAAT